MFEKVKTILCKRTIDSCFAEGCQCLLLPFRISGEFETEFENILGNESGGAIDEKIRGRKAPAIVPLSPQFSFISLQTLKGHNDELFHLCLF
jgi:hypothetical protein